MRLWQVIVVVVLLFFLLLLITPKLKILSFLSSQGSIKPESLTGEFDLTKTQAIYDNKPVAPPLTAKEGREIAPVLGESEQPKRIEIDLTNQRLYAYEGDQKIYDFAISSGKWGRTPTGRFRIWIKLRYVLMTGGSQVLGTYYYLPNVPYTMFFYNEVTPQWVGFGIHGTYWHNNFGHPMSHGCVNMRTEDAEQLYYWARPDLNGKNSGLASANNPGTEVVIYGDAPYE